MLREERWHVRTVAQSAKKLCIKRRQRIKKISLDKVLDINTSMESQQSGFRLCNNGCGMRKIFFRTIIV